MAENSGARVTPAEDGMKLIRFLERRLEDVPPKALLQKWIRTGQVRINKKRAKPFALLSAGDVVRVPPFAALRPVADDVVRVPPFAALHPVADAYSLPINSGIAKTDTAHDFSLQHPVINEKNELCVQALSQNMTAPETKKTTTLPITTGSPDEVFSTSLDTVKRPGVQSCTKVRSWINDNIPMSSCGLPFSIIGTTSDLLVINKPAGLPVQPGTDVKESLSGALAAVYARQPFIPAPAHRIDRHTSGIVLAGLTHTMQQQLHTWFAQEGGIDKEYLAWVALYEDGATQLANAGLITTPKDWHCLGSQPTAQYLKLLPTLNAAPPIHPLPKPETPDVLTKETKAKPPALSTDNSENMTKRKAERAAEKETTDVMPIILLEDLLAKHTVPGGQEKMQVVQHSGLMAKSRVRLLSCIPYERFFQASPYKGQYKGHGNGYTLPKAAALVHVQLLTGRTHQIRVQLASRGLPIIGDGRYSGPWHAPMLLHAWRVTLPDGRCFSALPSWPAPFAIKTS